MSSISVHQSQMGVKALELYGVSQEPSESSRKGGTCLLSRSPRGKFVSRSQTAFEAVMSFARQTSLFSNGVHRIGAVSGFWDEVDAL